MALNNPENLIDYEETKLNRVYAYQFNYLSLLYVAIYPTLFIYIYEDH